MGRDRSRCGLAQVVPLGNNSDVEEQGPFDALLNARDFSGASRTHREYLSQYPRFGTPQD
jgi:hypothetical protein